MDISLNGAPPVITPMGGALDLAQRQAAKFGLQGNHLDPLSWSKTSAMHLLRNLMNYIQNALKANRDEDYVTDGLERLLNQGTGASTQRHYHHHGGFDAVLEEAEAIIAA